MMNDLIVFLTGKWAVSWGDYWGRMSHYPSYCAGLAYVMRPALGAKLLAAAQLLPFFWIDDVYVTGILAAAVQARHFSLNLRYTHKHVCRPWLIPSYRCFGIVRILWDSQVLVCLSLFHTPQCEMNSILLADSILQSVIDSILLSITVIELIIVKGIELTIMAGVNSCWSYWTSTDDDSYILELLTYSFVWMISRWIWIRYGECKTSSDGIKLPFMK